jgi:hypothetical protein
MNVGPITFVDRPPSIQLMNGSVVPILWYQITPITIDTTTYEFTVRNGGLTRRETQNIVYAEFRPNDFDRWGYGLPLFAPPLELADYLEERGDPRFALLRDPRIRRMSWAGYFVLKFGCSALDFMVECAKHDIGQRFADPQLLNREVQRALHLGHHR